MLTNDDHFVPQFLDLRVVWNPGTMDRFGWRDVVNESFVAG